VALLPGFTESFCGTVVDEIFDCLDVLGVETALVEVLKGSGDVDVLSGRHGFESGVWCRRKTGRGNCSVGSSPGFRMVPH